MYICKMNLNKAKTVFFFQITMVNYFFSLCTDLFWSIESPRSGWLQIKTISVLKCGLVYGFSYFQDLWPVLHGVTFPDFWKQCSIASYQLTSWLRNSVEIIEFPSRVISTLQTILHSIMIIFFSISSDVSIFNVFSFALSVKINLYV